MFKWLLIDNLGAKWILLPLNGCTMESKSGYAGPDTHLETHRGRQDISSKSVLASRPGAWAGRRAGRLQPPAGWDRAHGVPEAGSPVTQVLGFLGCPASEQGERTESRCVPCVQFLFPSFLVIIYWFSFPICTMKLFFNDPWPDGPDDPCWYEKKLKDFITRKCFW